jgi:tetratricopeptide (TPR) repeat protein
MKLREEGHLDEETLGILARTHKDFWAQATDPAERRRQLKLAHKFYAEAYKLHRGYYAGINAATLSLQLGKNDQAVALAREVRESCLKVLTGLPENDPNRYWPLATLGEADLILRRWSEAHEHYAQAAELGRRNFVELSSTRRNARLILDHLGRDRGPLESAFKIPRVAVFSGHMIDRSDRATPRFPAHLEATVRKAIRARLKKHDIGIGFASAACGSDILFLETLLELGGDVHIVLPFEKERFIEESVEIGQDSWRERFDRVQSDEATRDRSTCKQQPQGKRIQRSSNRQPSCERANQDRPGAFRAIRACASPACVPWRATSRRSRPA